MQSKYMQVFRRLYIHLIVKWGPSFSPMLYVSSLTQFSTGKPCRLFLVLPDRLPLSVNIVRFLTQKTQHYLKGIKKPLKIRSLRALCFEMVPSNFHSSRRWTSQTRMCYINTRHVKINTKSILACQVFFSKELIEGFI